MVSELLPLKSKFKLDNESYVVVKNKTNSCNSCDLKNKPCVGYSFKNMIPICDRRKIDGSFVTFRKI